ncbi:hypothetical protein M9Y10_041463 [Tritrichomonas musculus]|uniref:Uncharacterized protein n=1 Tax=Tritrichomonas musculus TaxID=1915356 RepID=A0ABR2K4F4_9EUKA
MIMRATNLRTYLTKLQEDIIKNIGSAELLPGSELLIIENEISTKEVDVSSYSKLIAALGNNNTGILSAIDHLYTALGELDTFSVSDFLATTLQKNETMTTIKENKAENIYEATQENIEKYTELVSTIKSLSESLKNILIVEKSLNLKYINEIKTEKPEEEIPLAVQEDEKQYIYTYQTANEHADTLTEIINLINKSTENIEKWLKKIEETKTTGIDFTKLSELKVIQKNQTSYETKPQSLTTFNDVITNLSTNNENISNWINKVENESIVALELLESFGPEVPIIVLNETTKEPEIKTVKIEIVEQPALPTPEQPVEVPDFIVDTEGNNYLFPTKEEIDRIREKYKNQLKVPLPVDNSTGITIPVYVAIESIEEGLIWIKNMVYNILSTFVGFVMQPISILNNIEDIEVLVCIKVNEEYAFKKLVISNEKTSSDSTDITVPDDALVEKTEGQFVDKDNNVKFSTNDLADIAELQKNNVTVKTNITDSINIVINSYKTLWIVIKHTFSILNSWVLNPGAHFAINSSKFLWNNLITPGLRYGIDEYGKIKKYVINWGDDNEFLPTPAEDDSEILKYLKDKAIATQEIAINTWEDLYDFFKTDNPGFYVALASMIYTIAVLSGDCVRNSELLEEDELPDGLEEIFTPNKYSIVDTIYKLIRKLNNHIKNHPSSSGDSNFTIKNGYPEYEIKNDDIKPSSLEKTIRLDDTEITKKYNILTVDIPTELKTKLLTIKEHTNIFKITLRKNVVYDEQGNYIREFYIYVYHNKFIAPIVIKRENGCYLYNSSEISDTTSIAFDQELDFNPYDLYLRGELSINYEPSQDALVSTKPVVKCDIIEADNALKLQKSDIYYFYKPSKIIDEDAYYKMIYEIPTNYVFPNNMQFVFKEYCFGNEWKLTWNGTNWNGDNIKGRSNGKVIYKLKKNDNKDPFGSHGCYVMCKHDEWNQKFVPSRGSESENFMEYLWTKGKVEVSVKTKNGVVHPASDYSLHLNWYPADIKFEGYDLLGIDCVITEIDSSKIKVNEIDKIFADIYARAIPFTMTKYNDVATRLEFSPGSYHIDNTNHVSHVDIDAILDTIEKINYKVSGLKSFDKNIELYLYKQYTDPVDEVNWDSTTNPFDYIIKQQFYEIIPRPDAATTLYTDYNITSSKIITADNITTMRSDLNLVTNNVDVMNG